ncbi:MAG: nucleoside triphosphate pyrophosphohydrolase [Oligoflexia bacterium]|nr:nucleoside triphosphate pyrophosphohydrolase [Oligoflexia bacterium]
MKIKTKIKTKTNEYERLLGVIESLRHPVTGCPWDLKQNHHTLLKFLIEECYEYINAVEKNDHHKMQEELGDVLLQVILHATIAKENGSFDIEMVSKTLADKLIYRHPHVFAKEMLSKNSKHDLIKGENLTPEEVLINWEKLKGKAKAKANDKANDNSIEELKIDDGYLSFPALYSAYKIGKKTNQISFDWESFEQVLEKVEEEFSELKDELKKKKKKNKKNNKDRNSEKIKEELGDLLFTVAQLCRYLEFEPEETLRAANKKFMNRFKVMAEIAGNKKHINDVETFKSLSLEEKEELWKNAKNKIKKNNIKK